MNNNKNIVITGAGGFIGANLVRKLLAEHYGIHVLWKKSSSIWRLKEIKHKLIFHEINLNNATQMKNKLRKIMPLAIFHLAAHGAYRNQEEVKEMMKVSINGTINLLLASKDISYRIFVNTGSSSEYGFKNQPMRETDLLEPFSFYAAVKASATLLCQAFAFQYKKPIVTFRPFSIYGPYESYDRFIPTIIRALINNESIRLTPGYQRRDFVYVEDLVEAYTEAIQNGNMLKGKLCNIGTGKEYSNDEVVQILFKIAGKKVNVEKGRFPKRSWDNPHWVADISQTKKILKWKPNHTLEKGLQKTYEWFIKNKHIYHENRK